MKNNIKKVITTIVFILTICGTFAQSQTKREKMEALKIAYITEKLDLTVEESKVFWPLMNQYQNEKKALNTRVKGEKKENIDDMSDKEVEKLVAAQLVKAQKTLSLRIEYIEKFKKILPIKKVAKLIKAEKSFRKEVLKRLKQNK